MRLSLLAGTLLIIFLALLLSCTRAPSPPGGWPSPPATLAPIDTAAPVAPLPTSTPAPTPTSHPPTVTPTPIPAFSSLEKRVTPVGASISSQSKVAYLWDGDLYLSNLDGSERVRLTQNRTGYYFEWSPDGDKLAFLTVDPETTETRPRTTSLRLWEVSSGKTISLPVPEEDMPRRFALSPGPFAPGPFAWSSDGKRLAFQGGAVPELIEGEPAPTPLPLTIIDVESLSAKRTPVLDDELGRRWEASLGRWVSNTQVSIGRRCSTQCVTLSILDVDNGERMRLPNNGGWDLAPDGKRIVYREWGMGRRVFTINLDGSDATLVYQMPERIRLGEIREDIMWLKESEIAFSQSDAEEKKYHGYVLNLSTGAIREIEGLYMLPKANISPDGHVFVLAQSSWGAPLEQRALFMVDMATGERKEILPGREDYVYANFRWAPDGSAFAFFLTPPGVTKRGLALWVMAVDGGGLRQLAP